MGYLYLFLPATEDEKFPESLLSGQTNVTTHTGGMYCKEAVPGF